MARYTREEASPSEKLMRQCDASAILNQPRISSILDDLESKEAKLMLLDKAKKGTRHSRT